MIIPPGMVAYIAAIREVYLHIDVDNRTCAFALRNVCHQVLYLRVIPN